MNAERATVHTVGDPTANQGIAKTKRVTGEVITI